VVSCKPSLWETAFENGQISNFEGLVTLTLDQVILHTVMPHSSTSTYMSNFIKIEESFCGRTDVRTNEHFRPASLGRLCQKVNLKITKANILANKNDDVIQQNSQAVMIFRNLICTFKTANNKVNTTLVNVVVYGPITIL